ncbi:hypothetical protein ABZZ47_25635 [Streptomyces sp. NPDC006465]|uniref:hypothetical protein n=1 Tax=Streptomyces sp. NPDC006465 TaxID=3157174 RepID=UPI0033A68B4A
MANLCDGFTAHGRIRLSSATIRSSLCFDGALLDAAADEKALICRGATASVLTLHLRDTSLGTVDLSRTRVGLLQDESTAWPASLVLEGKSVASRKRSR